MKQVKNPYYQSHLKEFPLNKKKANLKLKEFNLELRKVNHLIQLLERMQIMVELECSEVFLLILKLRMLLMILKVRKKFRVLGNLI